MIKTLFYSFFCLFGLQNALAQNIVIEETNKHVIVTGTHLKIVPPPDFERGQNFYGFQQQATNSTIIVFEVKNEFSKQTAGFTEAHLRQAGFKVNEVNRFKLNEDSAVYVSALQEWEGNMFNKEILAIGNSSRTVVINAACLAQHPEMVRTLKEALYTSFIDDEPIQSAIDLVDFTLNPSGTGLNLYTPGSEGLNALVYNNPQLPGNPLLVATKSLITIQQDHKSFAKESISRLGVITPVRTTLFEEITINGLAGYQTLTEGKDKNGNNALLYHVLLFTPDNYYYSLAGRTISEKPKEDIERFKLLIKTFQRR
jgi:hypothetical protein